jgi:16S rRNA (uracil1498-N3)-methyltransferase
MKRFFLSPGSLQGRRMVFTGPDARYITRSLRLKRGAEIVGFDGAGMEYTGTIAILSPRRVEAVISQTSVSTESPSLRIALAQSLLKGRGLDGVLRQATELGISEFIPLATRYTIPRLFQEGEKRRQRWARIAADASRQSGRKVNPVVHPVEKWKDFLARAPEYDLSLLPWEKERERSLKEVTARLAGEGGSARILVAIGPEGGFTESEAAEAVEAGFLAVSLGPRILRATTAGVAAVAYLQIALGEGAGTAARSPLSV